MRLKFLADKAIAETMHKAGDVVDVDDEIAADLIDLQIAVEIHEQETATLAPVPTQPEDFTRIHPRLHVGIDDKAGNAEALASAERKAKKKAGKP